LKIKFYIIHLFPSGGLRIKSTVKEFTINVIVGTKTVISNRQVSTEKDILPSVQELPDSDQDQISYGDKAFGPYNIRIAYIKGATFLGCRQTSTKNKWQKQVINNNMALKFCYTKCKTYTYFGISGIILK
jgi:hypothetical protein